MKSSAAQLASRGFISGKELSAHREKTDEALCALLESGNPSERTAAVMILSERDAPKHLPRFCAMLRIEKKLYTKLALCDAITSCGEAAIGPIAELIGEIGSNQHRLPANADLGKKSFPLPRDIAARILIRLGTAVIPSMERILDEKGAERRSEAIDVIGHVAWTSGDTRSERKLLDLYAKTESALLRWKIVRALRSFHSEETFELLVRISESGDAVLRNEAKRSLAEFRTK